MVNEYPEEHHRLVGARGVSEHRRRKIRSRGRAEEVEIGREKWKWGSKEATKWRNMKWKMAEKYGRGKDRKGEIKGT